jgi:glycosyltransferase involved in cell wall biosynthesis
MRDALFSPGNDAAPAAISIVMLLRGSEAMLEASIASVRAQSCATWELLAIDDGSNDAGLVLMEEAAAADPRIRILHSHAAHPAAACNLGAMVARAPLLAFLQAGDLWATGKLARHLVLHRNQPDLVASYARMAYLAPDASALIGARRCSTLPGGMLSVTDVLGQDPSCMACNLVVRRQSVLVGGGFDETLAHAQDQDLLARLVRDGARIGAIDAVLTGHRQSMALPAHPARMQESWQQVIARHIQGEEARRLEALHCRDIAQRVLGSGGRVSQALPHAWAGVRLDAGAFFGGWRQGLLTTLACMAAVAVPAGWRRRLFA